MNPAEPETLHSAAPARTDSRPTSLAWPPAVLAGIERELARFVGPLAEMLVRRAAQQHHTTEALVAALLPSIESQQERDAFSRTCMRRAVMHQAPTVSAPAPAPILAPTAAPLPVSVRMPVPVAVPVALAPPPPPPPPQPVRARASSPANIGAQAGSALLRAADALLGALPHLRTLTVVADAAVLRAQLLQQLAAFEAEARACGVSPSHIAGASSVLRSLADEVIADSPWGAQGLWAAHALLSPPLHPEPLDLLQQVLADPLAHAPLIELFHVCLALGFEGRLRHTPQAAAQLGPWAARLHALLPSRRGRAGAPRTLSPHWRGLATRGHRGVAALPLWVVAAFCGALLLVWWLALNARLDARARPVFARIAAVPAALQSAGAAAGPQGAATAAKPRLAAALADDAQIEVRDDAQRSLITLPADSLFVAESARLDPRADALLARVAQALRSPVAQGGEISVIGHGDDAGSASLQFPTAWHLTRARAQAVADALVVRRVVPARAEGRAEFEPRAANTTPAGRALNRRIEIELRLPRPEETAQ